MDPTLYRAAMEGKVHILLQNLDQLEVQVTPNENTVLHIAALFGKEECVEVILRNSPSLLSRVNIKGETALHIAAREGHLAAIRALIECAKPLDYEELESAAFGDANRILRQTSNDGNTALHEAVCYCHPDIVKLLLEQDPAFSYPPNKAEETPLYLAAKNGLDDCVSNILTTCTSPLYTGPGGQTALHAAVIFNSEESTKNLVQWKPILSEQVDQMGWTPLHYAAHLGHVQRVSQLLNFNQRVAYATTDNDEMTTALHLAANRGHVNVMQNLISHCPDCSEKVNGRGQNILHTAVENNEEKVIKFILETPLLTNLINQEDNEGSTPLHLLGASDFYLPNHDTHLKAESMDISKGNVSPPIVANREKCENVSTAVWRSHIAKADSKDHDAMRSENSVVEIVDQIITVNKDMTVPTASNTYQIKNTQTWKRRKYTKEYIDGARKMAETHLIVAALVATVAFTAGFTMPGGYIQASDTPVAGSTMHGGHIQASNTPVTGSTMHGGHIQASNTPVTGSTYGGYNQTAKNEGMAVLTKHMAFRAFIVTDALALVLSTSAIFIYIGLDIDEKEEVLMVFIEWARLLVLLAIEAMMIAFVTGTYAVLEHSSGLAIATCIIGCSSFLIHFGIIVRAIWIVHHSTQTSELNSVLL